MGVDMWSAEILLRLKEQPEYGDIQLIVAVPFEEFDNNWDGRHKNRTHAKVVVVSSKSGTEGYRERNYYMVDHADYLLAVYDNIHTTRSGTEMTVNYAKKRGLPITYIHPDTAIVMEEK